MRGLNSKAGRIAKLEVVSCSTVPTHGGGGGRFPRRSVMTRKRGADRNGARVSQSYTGYTIVVYYSIVYYSIL